ncbi:MAG: type II secretion system F family protein [Patescibacteria group bacterium]
MDFYYQARDTTGKVVEGTIDAPSEDQAVTSLQQKELLVLSVRTMERGIFQADLFSFFNRPSRKDLIVFTRQLATLIEADVPLLEGLNILYKQTERNSFRKIIGVVIGNIEGGASLSTAFAEHERVFDNFFTSMIHVGEVAGKMQETLSYLADYLERTASLNSKIRGAMFYPAFVLLSLVVVSIVMMTTVIPQLLTIIRDSGVTELPLPTRILIGTTDFFTKYIFLLVVGFLLACAGGISYVRTEQGRQAFDRFKIHIPKFGKIIRDLYIARIAETLSTLIHAGVPILEGVEITANVVGNEVYKKILMEARTSIQSGGTLSAMLQQHPEFPSLVSSMISTGERTGRTDFMLQHILKFYKTEAENDVANLSQLIEPLLILLLGIGVGGLVAAVLLPIYSLINAV